jgi:eukaryotic-like serine/threonine-protein kinase
MTEEPTRELELAQILEHCNAPGDDASTLEMENYLQQYPALAGDLSDCLGGLAAMDELRQAIEESERDAATAPRRVGDFELSREIGRGGMGVVYEAHDLKLKRRVALKMIKSGEWASPEEVARFRAEAEAVARLQHPNIVQIYAVGEQDGRPYLALEFIDGGSLEALLSAKPLPAPEAAALVETLARAVHYAHQCGIVHRDLKPANVLLTRGGTHAPADSISLAVSHCPKVTDFGLAKRLQEGEPGPTHSGAIMGTPSYMSPEQAGGRSRDIGPATDVYALGAILYECLTGRPPFKAANPMDTLMQVLADEPVPPSRLQPTVPRDLETICLKCLAKDVPRRYPSALELAEELQRFQRGEPIRARPCGYADRVLRWCRRNPGVASLVLTAATLLLLVGGLLALHLADVATARAREDGRKEEILRSVAYAADGVAGMVDARLQELSRAVERTSVDPRLRKILQDQSRKGLLEFLEWVKGHYDDPRHKVARSPEDHPFKNWFVLDRQGKILAITSGRTVVGQVFKHRDYFQGAMRLAEQKHTSAVHISRVFHSLNDDLYKFGISAPVRAEHDPNAEVLGVLVATVTTDKTMGLPKRLHDERQNAVLLGRPEDPAQGGDYVILLHPRYEPGAEPVRFPADRLREGEDEYYEDPVGALHAEYAVHWIAAFAPVRDTEFKVIVQQRFRPSQGGASLLNDAGLGLGVSLLAILGVCLGGWYWWQTRKRAAKTT